MSKIHRFDWSYCECGCKSYECQIAGKSYSLFWDLNGGYYIDGVKFNSWDAAEKSILKELKPREKELIEQRKSINKVLKMLKDIK